MTATIDKTSLPEQDPHKSDSAPSIAVANAGLTDKNKAKPTERSTGEVVFDQGIYTGIGYFLNLGISIIIADYLLHGNGRPILDKTSNLIDKHLVSNFVKGPKSGEISFNALKTLALLSGGTALLFPVLWMENHKRRLVYQINQTICPDKEKHEEITQGKPLKDVPATNFPAIYDEPEKQHWSNAITRRIYGAIAVISASTVIDRTIGNKNIEEYGVKLVNKGLGAMNIAPLAHNGAAHRYAELTTLDAIFTVITAAAIYLSRPDEKNKEAKAQKEVVEPATGNFVARVEGTVKNDRALLASASRSGHVDRLHQQVTADHGLSA